MTSRKGITCSESLARDLLCLKTQDIVSETGFYTPPPLEGEVVGQWCIGFLGTWERGPLPRWLFVPPALSIHYHDGNPRCLMELESGCSEGSMSRRTSSRTDRPSNLLLQDVAPHSGLVFPRQQPASSPWRQQLTRCKAKLALVNAVHGPFIAPILSLSLSLSLTPQKWHEKTYSRKC